MKVGLIDRSLTEDNYLEYIEKIINIFRLSTKSSSIILNIIIKNYEATIDLSIINQEGEKEDFTDVCLKCDNVFYESFLIPLVKKINNLIIIKTKDIVNLDSDELVTFRMITENNDLFTIDGLSMDDAEKLLSLSDEIIESGEQNNLISNSEGIGNTKIFLLLIIVLIIVFVFILLFVN